MAETFDTILKGGTVVNQDGIFKRDVAIRHGQIADIGVFDAEQAGLRQRIGGNPSIGVDVAIDEIAGNDHDGRRDRSRLRRSHGRGDDGSD